MAANRDFEITQGKTFSHTLRWEIQPVKYKAISGIDKVAPVRIHCPAHELTDGWRAAVVSVKGMAEINAANTPPKATDYHRTTVVDADTIEFNDVNAADFKAYTTGGYVMYNTPVDLAGYTARLSIKTKVGGTLLKQLLSPTDIVIDNGKKTITLNISAADTAVFGWKKGVYELEMVNGDYVTAILTGNITVSAEIAT